MHTEDTTGAPDTRSTIERGLAILGFVALVGCGIWLAIYSAKYVPTAVNRIGTAAVVLSSFFVPGDSSLTVIPTASTTNPLGSASSTPITPKPTTPKPKPATTPGASTGGTYPVGTSTTPISTGTLSGLPDLKTEILAIGYLSSTSTDSFIATSTVPAGARPAVKFVVSNTGTNIVATGWHFSAAIPTQNAYVFYSPAQPSLAPGDRIEYTLGFDQASPGVNRSISIVADSDQRVGESSENNNSATGSVTIKSN